MNLLHRTALFALLAPTTLLAQGVTYTCGTAKAPATQLTAKTTFTPGPHASGWDLEPVPTTFTADACSSAKPFFFSINAPDGNYQVTLVAGGPAASNLTVKAESRRLMVWNQAIPAGGSHTFTFIVNVRNARINATQNVKLKQREIGALDWDDKLTLEFNGENPSIRSLSIKPVKVPTIYIAGDSTVVDQDKEPWAAWGQMIPLYFGPEVAISNQAESGETSKSFVGEKRLDKIMSTIQPGDYLMIQFGHNDQKSGTGYVAAMGEFKDILKSYISQAKSHGASTILVTPMNRRNFDPEGHITATLGDYPQAMKDIAADQHLGLIDLNAVSKVIYETLGKEGTLHAFVHYPANTFPEQPTELKDDTHFNAYGAYLLAQAIIQGIQSQSLPIAKFLRPNIPSFEPTKPLAFTAFALPASPFVSTATPYGR